MPQFLVLFREPDGRKDPHTPEPKVDHRSTDRRSIISPFPSEGKFPDDPETEKITEHRKNWNFWSEQMNKEHRIAGGMPLTLAGKVLGRPGVPVSDGLHEKESTINEGPHKKGTRQTVTNGPHKVGEEIVGGYLLINANSLDEATSLMQSCPIFEFGGYAEIREGMTGPSLQEQNKAIVRRFNTAFIQDGDITAFHEIIDPSVINHTAPAGFSKGADGMFAVIDLFRKALTGIEVKILRQVAEDDIVVTHKAFHAIHTGTLMGTPPSGQPIVITIIDIVRLRNGRYIEHWGIRDAFVTRPAH